MVSEYAFTLRETPQWPVNHLWKLCQEKRMTTQWSWERRYAHWALVCIPKGIPTVICYACVYSLEGQCWLGYHKNKCFKGLHWMHQTLWVILISANQECLFHFYQYVTCPTRLTKCLVLCYGSVKQAYKTLSRAPLGMSDYNVVYLVRSYFLKRNKLEHRLDLVRGV